MRTGERRKRLPAWLLGFVMVIVIAVGSVLAYTKELPWSDAFTASATFDSAQNVRPRTPVRIAGVNVGEVTQVEHLGDPGAGELASAGDPSAANESSTGGVKVTFELAESALPLHEDAQFKVRPRLFLEGNYFIEVSPGSPSSPTVGDGHSFPINQTAHSVQLDQVLTTLQADVRTNLQTLLRELGAGFIVHGGADGFRQIHKTSPDAYRYTAVVNEALLGTEEGDLSGTINGLEKVLGGLAADEQELRDLVTNFRAFTGSFAAEDQALAAAIEQLPDTLAAADPAFTSLNNAFPPLRAFAREALPGVRSSAPSLRASRPFIEQLRLLMSKPELRGLVRELKPTVPRLARLNRENIGFFEQNRALSSCFNEVVVPWGKDEVKPIDPANKYDHDPFGKVFEETWYGITGTAGESRSGDANGQTLRTLGASGANLIRTPSVGGLTSDAFALTPFEVLGSMPRPTDSVRGEFQPDVPCETQEPPNLEANGGPGPSDQTPLPRSAQGISGLDSDSADSMRAFSDTVSKLGSLAPGFVDGDAEARRRIRRAQRMLNAAGLDSVDLRQTAKELGR
jgi:ABC-type transporter Mla subunit MlaD